MIFSPQHYRRLRSRLRLRYQSQWKLFSRNLKKLPSSPLKEWIQHHKEELSEYTNLNWFYLGQLQKYLFAKTLPIAPGSAVALSKSEEKAFDLWNHSEFADVFLKKLNQGQSIEKASRGTLAQFEKHLLIMGKRHVEKVDVTSASYRHQSALGERIRNGKISPLLSTTLHLEGKELELKTPSLKEMNRFSQRIELALKLIRRFSPGSWERFVAFTDSIVPIRDEEFVSYSHQDLPGVSMINLYDRDFVDLMDDLLHENGHHHLNYFLNLERLIQEPAETIYYSPWRRTLRPLRGIYHAYFTFFWAFRLFSDLARQDLENIWYAFSPKEIEKIYWRAVEEYHMLSFSYEDLRWARKQGLIADTGWDLVKAQHRELLKLRASIAKWERKLVAHRKDLKKLKTELRSTQRKYRKT